MRYTASVCISDRRPRLDLTNKQRRDGKIHDRFIFCIAVAGAVSQQLLTDEIVTVREWVGGALIVIGAYLSARSPHASGKT